MVKKNNLFELIKALTPTEKRYFIRSVASEKNARNYVRLFREIDKMEQYDEKEIRRKFSGERFIKQIHVMKIYLQDRIVWSLRNYHATSSLSIQLKDLLKNIEIYFNKELYNICILEILKAEKLARRFEDDVTLIEILNWKRKIAQSQSPSQLNIAAIINEQASAVARLSYQNVLWKHIAGDPAAPVIPAASASTLASKALIHHIRYRDAVIHKKNDEARDALEELLVLLEKHPHRIQEDPGIYLTAANNLISFFVFTKAYDQALKAVEKTKSVYQKISEARKNKNTFRLILRTYNIELEIYRDNESLDPAANLIKEILGLLAGHKAKIPTQYLISLWFQFAYIFFLRKEFKTALRWINEILNSPFAVQRKDLHLQAHFLNLMVHYELRNFFVMGYFVGSTKRFFIRNKALRPFHKILLAFFIKVSSAPENDHKGLFEKLRRELFADTATVPASDLDYINWIKWIDGRVTRKG